MLPLDMFTDEILSLLSKLHIWNTPPRLSYQDGFDGR